MFVKGRMKKAHRGGRCTDCLEEGSRPVYSMAKIFYPNKRKLPRRWGRWQAQRRYKPGWLARETEKKDGLARERSFV